MTSQVRSVTVRLEAAVSKYVADMRMAGRETDKAFASAHASIAATNRELGIAEQRLGRTTTGTKAMSTAVTRLTSRSEKLQAGLAGVNTQLDVTDARLGGAARGVDGLGSSSRQAGPDIDRLSGRMKLLAQATAVFGPGLVPIAAVGIPALTGLANVAGVAAIAGVSAASAFQGVGDALKAVEEARLDPTAENLQAAQEAMALIGPDAQAFVARFQELRPVLREIRDSAAAGWFPGLTESLDHFEDLAPRVERLFEGVGRAGGDAIAAGTESLAGERWEDFFAFLETEAPDTLTRLSAITGDVAHGLSEMWMSFDPGNDDFLAFVGEAADGFDRWASSAEGREQITALLDYVRETGPQVLDFFGSTVDLLTQITQAAAPLGGPVLQGLTAVADILAGIAGSDLGTPILLGMAALSAYNRVLAVTGRLQQSTWGSTYLGNLKAGASALTTVTTAQDRARMSSQVLAKVEADRAAAVRTGLATLGKTAGVVGGLALASSGAADSIGLTNTASLALLGTLGGPWGIGVGAAVGLTMDLVAASGRADEAISRMDATIAEGDGSIESRQEGVAKLRQELATLQDDTKTNSFGEFFQNAFDPDVIREFHAEFTHSLTEEEQLLRRVAEEEQRIRDQQAFDRSKALLPSGGPDMAELLGGPLGLVDRSFENATMSAVDFARALERINSILTGRAELRDYEAAIDAARDALEANGRTLRRGTAAGRENAAALDSIAASALAVADNMGPLRRARFLENARGDFIDTAVAMGMLRPAARALADELGLLGRQKVKPTADLEIGPLQNKLRRATREVEGMDGLKGTPWADLYDAPFQKGKNRVRDGVRIIDGTGARVTIDANTPALGGIAAVRAALGTIDRTITVTINTVRNFLNLGSPKADGGLIRGPGGPRDDRVPIMASNGEYVVNAAATSRNLALLHSINTQKYADGGPVGLVDQTHSSSKNLTIRDPATTALGALGRSAREAAKGIDEREKSEKNRERRREQLEQQRERLQSRASDIRSGISNAFGTDPFANIGSDVWAAGGGGDPLSTVMSTNVDLRRYRRLLRLLEDRGLSGSAFETAAASGNLAGLETLAGYSRAELRRYEREMNLRGRLLRQTGNQAVNLSGITARMDRIEDLLKAQRRDHREEGERNRQNRNDNTERQRKNFNAGVAAGIGRIPP